MALEVFWQRTWQEFLLLLKAPILEPEMWWIITPLLVTFLVMTFYFGVYRKEKLGWNTAIGNTIVLLFVALDLLRHTYNYTIPGSVQNFAEFPLNFVIIFIVILEALFLFSSAFWHTIPEKIMFFLASPLPVNLQAYVITALVYLKFPPEWYTLSAAALLFIMLFLASRGIQFVQRLFIESEHKSELEEIKQLKKEARQLKQKAEKAKGKKAKKLKQQAREKKDEAKALEKDLKEAEKKEHGKLVLAKKIKK